MNRTYVLDTDVVVSSLRSQKGASRQLLMAALDRHFELLISVPLILEYEAVLTRPQHLAESGLSTFDIAKVLDDLVSIARHVKLAYRWRPALSDPGDDMVLETAVNGTAYAIVTFNESDFKIAEKTFNLKILSPAAALLRIRGQYEKK